MKELRPRAIIACLQFQIVLLLMLLLPARTLEFWQAWLYWMIFGAIIFTLTLYFLKHDPALIERRMSAGPQAETERSQQIIMSAAALFCGAMWIVPGIDHHAHWSRIPTSAVFAGDLMVVLGMTIIFYVFKSNTYTASTVKVEEQQRVVSTGLYGIVRHPMYFGGVIIFAGTPLALGSGWAEIPAFLLIGTIVIRLLCEEAYLQANLPGYSEYQKTVNKRLLPFIW